MCQMKNAVLMPEINLDDCTGCGDCVAVCPTGGLKIINSKVTLSSDADCTYCAECEYTCAADAIECPYEIVLADESTR
jgi:NAD-dependent dihydropyrimidine dehydrogenase PreA subunit